MVAVPKEIKMIKLVKKFIQNNNLDGYIIPKNDTYFTEYSNINNLAKVTNFTGSAGFALILEKNNYLFVDGRYTLQARNQAGKYFKVLEIPFNLPKSLSNIKNYKIGFDPKLFTKITLENYFGYSVNLIPIKFDFKNRLISKKNNIFILKKSITGENSTSKIKRVIKYLKVNKLNYIYISAGENVNWLLNIRGKDLPHAPLVNCKLIITDKSKLYLFRFR